MRIRMTFFVLVDVLSGEELPRGQVEAVPLLMGEPEGGCGADVPEMGGVHGAGDGLHAGGMPQDPGDGHGGLRHAVLFPDLTQRPVQLRAVRMVLLFR